MSDDPRTLLQYAATALIGLTLIGFGLYQAWDLLQGPQLTVTAPRDGATLSQQRITLEGAAQQAAFLTLNGRQIYTNTAGEIAEPLLLQRGYNIITVTVRGRFGRTESRTLRTVVQ